jgi:hypothetical protein
MVPKKNAPQAQVSGELINCGSEETVREVVVTVTLNVVTVLASTDIVDGTEQLAPVGAPVQVKDAVPPAPPPPIVSE